MYVVGLASTTRGPGRPPGSMPMRASATTACARGWRAKRAAARPASTARTMWPRVWRWPGATARQHADARLRDHGLRAGVAREAGGGPAGQHVEDHVAQVVAVARVRRPGVAEPDDEPGLVGHVASSFVRS